MATPSKKKGVVEEATPPLPKTLPQSGPETAPLCPDIHGRNGHLAYEDVMKKALTAADELVQWLRVAMLTYEGLQTLDWCWLQASIILRKLSRQG